MEVALYRTPSQGSTRVSRSRPGFNQIQLGNELLVYARGSQQRSANGADGLGERLLDVEEDDLHLVIQIGNRFQQDHPEIPIVLNKGRFLVVNVDPSTAKKLEPSAESCCYMIRPLEGNEVIFDVAPPRAARSAPEPWVKDLTDLVSNTRIAARLTHLTSFHTRYSTSPEFETAAEWAINELTALGYSIQRRQITVGTGHSLNVIAEKTGNGSGAREVVLVVAHLDSINALGGPQAKSPGADDNGSGSIGVLEIAEILKNHNGNHDLRLILFGGEEEGLFGSEQYVAGLSQAERSRIRAVINMDMIATLNTPASTVLLEGAPLSQSVIDGLAEAASTYTTLTVQTSLDPFNSDHVPFINAGIPAVLTIEGTDSANHNVHTIDDNLSHINFPLMLEILKMNVAFTAKALEMQPQASTTANVTTPDAVATNNCPAIEARSNVFQFSGCYKHNNGASSRAGRGFIDRFSGQSTAAINNPIYTLEEPVYVESAEEVGGTERSNEQLRFTLNVDVDGIDALNVVSGTVASGPSSTDTASPHFIGRVTSNAPSMTGRVLTVQDFSFRWPESSNTIDRVTIELSGSALTPVRAQVVFHDTVQARDFGPYVLAQESKYFREVEIDVDREINAVEVEPVSTVVHPDRPADLPAENLTLESAFAKAGIRITRSSGSGTIVDIAEAGTDKRWNLLELHDSMQLHWDAFKNKPQWKMWLFMAELANDPGLGGVMFDGEIDEPGGVDRQGTAIFTKCPHFHTVNGAYIQSNPPPQEAVKRELFFNMIHETGHAFNLAHSFEKEEGMDWRGPAWMPLKTDKQALSWMNYPDNATPGGAGFNATWFYKRFRFRFDTPELLFLRHAPETYVEMGAAGWFHNHGRVARIDLDFRLKLIVRSRKQMYEFGEPVIVELRLSNESNQPITVHGNLDPSDGLVEMTVTNPDGRRFPFLPVDHTRTRMIPYVLETGKDPLYQAVDMTMGSFGFSFKKPGAYRIEASYTNIDGGCAAAVLQIYVRPPANYDVVPIVNELFNAKLGTAMYVEGTRVMGDVNARMDWVREGLNEELGPQNPISAHLTTILYKPLAKPCKVVEPSLESSDKVRVRDEEPDRFVANVAPVVLDNPERTANTMGHIWFGEVVDTFTEAAIEAGEPAKAKQAQEQLVGMFKERNVIKSVIDRAEDRMKEIERRQ
jgi:Peptidase family M28